MPARAALLFAGLCAALALTACDVSRADPTPDRHANEPDDRDGPREPREPWSPVFVAAGVPQDVAADRDYDALFDELVRVDLRTFVPTFQTREEPPAGLGFEVDFIPPFTPSSPNRAALVERDIDLIIPGPLLYPPPPGAFPPDDEHEPLRAVIERFGRDRIRAITTYDEPGAWVAVGPPEHEAYLEKLYARVKAVAPDLPVVMVHAPIGAAVPASDVELYLDTVARISKHAAIVGFDVYPYPQAVAQLAAPQEPGKVAPADDLIARYLDWQADAIPDAERCIVLQGFAYHQLVDDAERVPAPTAAQLDAMLTQARERDVSMVIWWGPSHMQTRDDPHWDAIAAACRRAITD